jgi:Uncharacterised protein family (UPF0158)
MKTLSIDFDEVQKAMEDTSREAFEYFLDLESGDVIILSEDILMRARSVLSETIEEDNGDYEEVEFDEEQCIPEWMEDEIELAIEIFLDRQGQYIRIPERNSGNGFEGMKKFTELLNNHDLKESLTAILDGKGVFRSFKDAIDRYPKEKKLWYGYNAKAAKKEIEGWLASLGVDGVNRKEASRDI